MPPSTTCHPTLKTLALVLLTCAACSDSRPASTQVAADDIPLACPPGTTRAAHQAICILDSCGDGVVDAAEACDDGNRIDGDGCSGDCQSTEVCGNGVLDFTVGELCDSGGAADPASCCADCRSCPALAVDPRPAPRVDTEPACDPAELRRARAELDVAGRNMDLLMAQANQASQAAPPARAPARRADQAVVNHATPARMRELETENADLRQQLAAVQQRLTVLQSAPANGRTISLRE